MIAQKNLTSLFITDTDAATTALPVVAGEFGVRRIGELLCNADALAAGDQFQFIVMDQKGKIVESPVYAWSNLLTKSIVNMAALASQVSTIGFNGTDGDIVATNSGVYLVTIGLKDMLKMTGNKRLYKYGEYTAGVTAHNHDIAIGLVDSLVSNFKKDAFQRVIPKVLASITEVASNKFVNDITVIKGSQYATSATTNHHYTSTTDLAVGDYVRFGASITTAPIASTADVYRVVELTSSSVFKVDRPITVDSGIYAQGSAATEVIPQALGEAASVKWGITLTGNDDAAPFEVGKFGNNLIHFSVGVSVDFATTEVRILTRPFIGQGTNKGVAQLDWELQANGREKYRIAEYPVVFTPNIATTSNTLTHVRTFTFKDNSTDTIGGTAESLLTLMIANTTTSDTNLNTIFTQS
jgi:hypothetical protein